MRFVNGEWAHQGTDDIWVAEDLDNAMQHARRLKEDMLAEGGVFQPSDDALLAAAVKLSVYYNMVDRDDTIRAEDKRERVKTLGHLNVW